MAALKIAFPAAQELIALIMAKEQIPIDFKEFDLMTTLKQLQTRLEPINLEDKEQIIYHSQLTCDQKSILNDKLKQINIHLRTFTWGLNQIQSDLEGLQEFLKALTKEYELVNVT